MRFRAFVLLLLLSSCRSAPEGFEEALLLTLPEDSNVLVPVAFSQDGRRAAYAARQPQGDDIVSCLSRDSHNGRVC